MASTNPTGNGGGNEDGSGTKVQRQFALRQLCRRGTSPLNHQSPAPYGQFNPDIKLNLHSAHKASVMTLMRS
jgi:hypothetical protein